MKKIALSYLCTAIVAVVIMSFGIETKDANAGNPYRKTVEIPCDDNDPPEKTVKRCREGAGVCVASDQHFCNELEEG